MISDHSNELAAPEAQRRRFRKLRIAWSVGWGVMAVLLIVLCVRSYWREEMVNNGVCSVNSAMGELIFVKDGNGWGRIGDLRVVSSPAANRFRTPRFFGGYSSGVLLFGFPHWFAVLAVVTLNAAPWLHWRFSLRTLLIAITAVAVILGLIVWIVR